MSVRRAVRTALSSARSSQTLARSAGSRPLGWPKRSRALATRRHSVIWSWILDSLPAKASVAMRVSIRWSSRTSGRLARPWAMTMSCRSSATCRARASEGRPRITPQPGGSKRLSPCLMRQSRFGSGRDSTGPIGLLSRDDSEPQPQFSQPHGGRAAIHAEQTVLKNPTPSRGLLFPFSADDGHESLESAE